MNERATAVALPMLAGLLTVLTAASAATSAADSTADATPGATPVATLDATAARVDGVPIPLKEAERRVHDTLALQQREYEAQYQRLVLGAARAREEELEQAVEDLIDGRVLELEATAARTTPDALLGAVQAAPVTESDERAFYATEGARLNQPFTAVQAQIADLLRRDAMEAARQRYLADLRQKHHAVVTREPLRETIDADGPQRGPNGAPVTLVEFSDFQCPYCGRLAPTLRQLLAAYPTQVRLIFKNLPLTKLHPDAAKAAQAAVCAKAQGKFWSMHDALYAGQDALSVPALKDKARRVGLDGARFDACLDSSEGAPAVEHDRAEAIHLGLTGTPSTFVNGRFVNGAWPLARWQALVEDELRRAPGAR